MEMSFWQKPSLTWQKFREFVSRPTSSRTLGLVGILAFVGIVSLTVIVAQQQQQIRQRAETPEVCSTIDAIPECTFLSNSSNVSCNKKTDRCKIDNAIYECQ